MLGTKGDKLMAIFLFIQHITLLLCSSNCFSYLSSLTKKIANINEAYLNVTEGGNTDMTTLDNTDISTDDLVPTLLGEDLTSDILDDVQSLINPASTKPDNVLTWL